VLVSGCRGGIAWAPDGKRLAVIARTTVYLFDIGTGRLQRLSFAGRHAVSPVFSPDGKRLACLLPTYEKKKMKSVALGVVQLPAGTLQVLVPQLDQSKKAKDSGPIELDANVDGLVGFALTAAWSARGDRLFYVTKEEERAGVWSIAASGGKPTRLGTVEGDAALPSFAPGGGKLACFSKQGGLELFEPGTKKARRIWEAPQGWAPSPFAGVRWSSDGSNLAIIVDKKPDSASGQPNMPSENGPCQVWTVPVGNGGQARKLAEVPGGSMFVSLSPDLKTIYFLGDQKPGSMGIGVLEAPYQSPRFVARLPVPNDTKEPRAPSGKAKAPEGDPGDEVPSLAPERSPDGKWLAFMLPTDANRKGGPRLVLAPVAGGMLRTVPIR
jgi:Tol biopolymer transport system component